MSIAEDIALDVADLPTDAFDVEGPGGNDTARSDTGGNDTARSDKERRGQRAPSLTAEHGIDDESPPSCAPAPHPLLDGPAQPNGASSATTHC